jgi:integrase
VTVYQVRVRLQDDLEALRTFTQTFDELNHAILWRDAKRTQIKLGEAGDKIEQRKASQTVTLGEIINRYKDYAEFQACPSYENECITLNAFLEKEKNGLAKKPLAFIEQADFRSLKTRWVYGPNRSMGLPAFKRQMNPIRKALRVARSEWKYQFQDPFRFPETFSWGDQQPANAPRCLTPNEVVKLFKEIDRRERIDRGLWISLITVALQTGLRLGTLLQIEWRDVNLTDRTLYVRGEIDKEGFERLLPLTYRAWSTLCSWHGKIKLPDYMTEDGEPAPHIPVFGAAYYRHLPDKKKHHGITFVALKKLFRRICDDAGIYKFTFHMLRHTATTWFDQIEMPRLHISYLLGHKDKTMTGHYVHAEQAKLLRKIRAELDAADKLLDEVFQLEEIAAFRQEDREQGHSPSRWDNLEFEEKAGKIVISMEALRKCKS